MLDLPRGLERVQVSNHWRVGCPILLSSMVLGTANLRACVHGPS